jgi:hypothetical protein
MIKYDIRNIPPDISPGDYATRVTKESHWEGKDLVIVAEYIGPLNPNNPSLFTLKVDPHES